VCVKERDFACVNPSPSLSLSLSVSNVVLKACRQECVHYHETTITEETRGMKISSVCVSANEKRKGKN